MNKEMDLNKLSFEELMSKVEEMEKKRETIAFEKKGIWKIGEKYVIRTVTMIQVGKLVYIDDNELGLETAAWVADTGRWTDFLTNGNANEVEPFPQGTVIVGRHAIIDACIWKHELLTKQK